VSAGAEACVAGCEFAGGGAVGVSALVPLFLFRFFRARWVGCSGSGCGAGAALVCVLFCSLCSFVLSSGSVGPSLEYGAVEGACLAVLAVKVMSPAFLSVLGGAFVSIGSVIVPWLVGGRRAQGASSRGAGF